jgi:hypothetical protein
LIGILKLTWHALQYAGTSMYAKTFKGNICLQSLNGSHITLIPKMYGPTKVSDFRPISVFNTSIKIITKTLANGLQKAIMDLIHHNQYGFILSRTIQYCLAWVVEYLHLCHKSRKELIILKLYFVKAFDEIEHQIMLHIMEHKGFNSTWLHWMVFFNSGTSSILLNGVPGKTFQCKREVRQGDPLSPLPFVLAVDFLQELLNKAKEMNLLNLPIPLSYTSDFPIIQYDTI